MIYFIKIINLVINVRNVLKLSVMFFKLKIHKKMPYNAMKNKKLNLKSTALINAKKKF